MMIKSSLTLFFCIILSTTISHSLNVSVALEYPVGSILEFAGECPQGFVPADGRSLSKADFPELFSLAGTTYGSSDALTFRIPDTRGIGIRGTGTQTFKTTASNDVTYSATLGQKRNDAIQNIVGEIAGAGDKDHPMTGVFAVGSAKNNVGWNGTSLNSRAIFDASRVVRTDTQTHGADIALNYCIKL